MIKEMQKRIRSIERLLRKHEKENNTGEAVSVLQNQLQEAKSAHSSHQQKEREKRMAKKYHMVKFVERQKLVRRLSE